MAQSIQCPDCRVVENTEPSNVDCFLFPQDRLAERLIRATDQNTKHASLRPDQPDLILDKYLIYEYEYLASALSSRQVLDLDTLPRWAGASALLSTSERNINAYQRPSQRKCIMAEATKRYSIKVQEVHRP